jgi:hypothetical protein
VGELDSFKQIVEHLRNFRQLHEQYRQSQMPSRASNDVDEDAQLSAAENSIAATSITPPLPIDTSVTVQNAFSFGLPSNFGRPPDETLTLWRQGWDSMPLAAVMDHGADEMCFMCAVFSGPSEQAAYEDLKTHMWAPVVLNEEFRQRYHQISGGEVTQGPTAILLDGERSVWFATRQIDKGVETIKWSVQTGHQSRGYAITMFALPHAETRYADAFWTLVGSWRWADSATHWAPIGAGAATAAAAPPLPHPPPPPAAPPAPGADSSGGWREL